MTNGNFLLLILTSICIKTQFRRCILQKARTGHIKPQLYHLWRFLTMQNSRPPWPCLKNEYLLSDLLETILQTFTFTLISLLASFPSYFSLTKIGNKILGNEVIYLLVSSATPDWPSICTGIDFKNQEMIIARTYVLVCLQKPGRNLTSKTNAIDVQIAGPLSK